MRTFGISTIRMPQAVRILYPLFSSLMSHATSYFHRLPRPRSWNGTWRIKLIRLRLCLGYWILEYRYVYTCRRTQFKCGGHRWWRHWWNSSNLRPRCRVVLLSTATFTDANRCVRRRHCTVHGSSSASYVGSRNACRDVARDYSTSKALCMCFRPSQL